MDTPKTKNKNKIVQLLQESFNAIAVMFKQDTDVNTVEGAINEAIKITPENAEELKSIGKELKKATKKQDDKANEEFNELPNKLSDIENIEIPEENSKRNITAERGKGGEQRTR